QADRKCIRVRANRGGSATPHSSRAECIDSWATPMSAVAIPVRAADSGPMVDPQGWSLRETNVWWGTPALRQASTMRAAVDESVAYRWLALILMTGPPSMAIG